MIAALLAAAWLTGGASSAGAQASAAPVERHAIVFGQQIHYLEAGAGPVVILLHGLGDSAGVWADTIPPLATRFHVYALDQIGFGESDKPMLNYRVQTLVDFLDGFLREARIARATLVGNSLGGWVAAAFAIAHPEKVEKLALIDPAGYWTGIPLTREWLSGLNPPTLAALRETLSKVFDDKSMLSEESVERAWAEQLKHGDGYTVSQFLESFLRREDTIEGRTSAITAPTLVVWGREDHLLPLTQGEAFARDIRGARLRVLDRCGHMPQVECPAALNPELLAFLTK